MIRFAIRMSGFPKYTGRNGPELEGPRGGGSWERLLAEAPDVLFVPGKPRYRKIFLRDDKHAIVGFADGRLAWDLVWKKVGRNQDCFRMVSGRVALRA